MSKNIKKVAVLGTGVMGGQIAAHLTNANFEVYAFDMDQETAENGLKATQEIKPAAFYNKKTATMITPMNYSDHLSKIEECDWVLEAISERIDWKKDLYSKIAPHLSDDAILTVATDGADLYSTELEKIKKDFVGSYDTTACAELYGQYFLGSTTDHMLELNQRDKERIFNLG